MDDEYSNFYYGNQLNACQRHLHGDYCYSKFKLMKALVQSQAPAKEAKEIEKRKTAEEAGKNLLAFYLAEAEKKGKEKQLIWPTRIIVVLIYEKSLLL